MSDEIPVNLPFGPGFPVVAANDRPENPDQTLIMVARSSIRGRIEALGLEYLGGGIGTKGSDDEFRLGDRRLVVEISIKDQP